MDGSSYQMDIQVDSDDDVYKLLGTKVSIYDLMYGMITASSNLATNILIELVGAKEVTATMRDLGAKNIEVLRGVEDLKAYDLGLNNSTTAKDLMLIMKAIADYSAGSKEDCDSMIKILKAQRFNEMIPRFLPKDVTVAHKTGSITGLHHDAAIVYLPDGRSYVLVLLSKNLKDFDKGTIQLAEISKTIYDYMMIKNFESLKTICSNPVYYLGITWPKNNTDVAFSKLQWAKDSNERDRIDFIYYLPDKRLILQDIVIVGPEGCVVTNPVKGKKRKNE